MKTRGILAACALVPLHWFEPAVGSEPKVEVGTAAAAAGPGTKGSAGQPAGSAEVTVRLERFDDDPGWEGINHRSEDADLRVVQQDFGFSRTNHAGGVKAGELGGVIVPAAEPAWYGRRIAEATFDHQLTASGTLAATGHQFHALVGFFNHGTLKEWRTPNTIALRIYGRGDRFYAFVEYATQRWRAGGDSPRPFPSEADPESGGLRQVGFEGNGQPHRWSLAYDPEGNAGGGVVTASIDNSVAVCHLDPGHKADGAAFDHFGLMTVMKSVDDGGAVWLDDILVNGERENFDQDPRWDALNNRRTYKTREVRRRFDFGFCKTRLAGGLAAGELGGLVYRGDCRRAETMACYGDRLDPLTLDAPLKAAGKLSLRRGVSDSTTLLGFYHSKTSMRAQPSQKSGIPESFLGIAIEGPSREGFLCYPLYRVGPDHQGVAQGPGVPHVLPDGSSHGWNLAYSPSSRTIALTFGHAVVRLDVPAAHQSAGATFNRFGLITTWIDGNAQEIYFDDLSYTFRQ